MTYKATLKVPHNLDNTTLTDSYIDGVYWKTTISTTDRKQYTNNSSGYVGVYKIKTKLGVRFLVKYKLNNLTKSKTFKNKEDAICFKKSNL
tara:strand:+ start:1952 stop:2224 length:273 start_codon:yes stop_codon:yes gene_type:complete